MMHAEVTFNFLNDKPVTVEIHQDHLSVIGSEKYKIDNAIRNYLKAWRDNIIVLDKETELRAIPFHNLKAVDIKYING